MFKISKHFKIFFLTVVRLVQQLKTFFKKTIDKFKNTVYNKFNKNEQEGGKVLENKYSKFVNTEELKKTREEKGFSIRDMSRFMGFKSPATYYNIENGIAEPKISHINSISKILKTSSSKFFNFKVQ